MSVPPTAWMGAGSRKAIISAAASTVETAKDINKLRPEHILHTLKLAADNAHAEEKAA